MKAPSEQFSKLLVCDDDRAFRQRLARSLRSRGFTVFEAEDARSALGAVNEFSPDGVVVDMRMPGESGLWLVQQVRERSSATRVVVLTGFGSINTALDAVRLGAVNYLTKPASVDAILAGFFPESVPAGTDEQLPSLAEVEAEYVQRVLAEHEGNVSQAAKVLGVHRRSLQRRLRKDS